MNSLDKRLQMSGFITFFLSGIYSISSGIVVSLLQERYGFDYNVTGTLLSIMSIGNLMAGRTDSRYIRGIRYMRKRGEVLRAS